MLAVCAIFMDGHEMVERRGFDVEERPTVAPVRIRCMVLVSRRYFGLVRSGRVELVAGGRSNLRYLLEAGGKW